MTMEMQSTAVNTAAKSKKRGFTLTEIAIVLGIVGLILGAIWVAAAAVYTNIRISNSNRHLLVITQNVRSLFSTSTVTGSASGTDMTTSLIPAGVFPTDLLPNGSSSTTVNSAWSGGQIHVYSSTGTAAGDAFTVQFEGIPSQGCINLLTAATGSGRDPGMIAAGGVANSSGGALVGSYTANNLSNAQATLSGVAAATACGNGATTVVAFQFRLRV